MSYANPYRAPQSPLNMYPTASSSSSSSSAPELRHVADGFWFQGWVVRLALLMVASVGGIMFLASTQLMDLPPQLLMVVCGGFALIIFVMQLMAFLSFNRCPVEADARGTANFGLIMFVVGTGGTVASYALMFMQVLQSPMAFLAMLGVSSLCSMIAAMSLKIYFRQIAEYLKDTFASHITNSLVNAAIGMYLALGAVLLTSLLTGAFPVFEGAGRDIAVPLLILRAVSSIVAAMLSVYVVSLYLATIGGMKQLLQSKLRRY